MGGLMWFVAWASAGPLDASPSVHTLPNGLTLVVEEQRRTDTVALHLRYGVGSRDERDGEKGCAHLFEHLMFEGSANVATNMFDTWLTAAGGANNAYTSEDETAYHMTFPSGALDLALFLESDRLGFLDAGLVEDNLDNQIQVVLQERRQGYEQPHGRDWDALSRLAFPEGHPYHVPVIGTVADVEGFELDAVRDFWGRHYRARNAVLVVVGNVDTDAVVEQVTHWFEDVPDRGEALPRAEVTPIAPFRADGVLEDRVEDRTLILSWPTVPKGHPDEPALDVLSYVLSDGRGTRLDDALYFRRELVSEIDTYSYMADLAGQFLVFATAPDTALTTLESRIEQELGKVARRGISDAAVDRARSTILAGWTSGLEGPVSRARAFVDCLDRHGRPDCFADERARYEAVTADDVQRVAAAYLRPDTRVSLSVVPTGDDGALPGARPVELP